MPHSPKMVRTLSNNALISFMTMLKTMTKPAKVVIMAWSSLPARTNTWCKTATNIPMAAILNNKLISIFFFPSLCVVITKLL